MNAVGGSQGGTGRQNSVGKGPSGKVSYLNDF